MEPIIGTANIIMQGIRSVPPRPPHTYFGAARALSFAIDPLLASNNCHGIPLAFICGQVTECALKAALSKDGNDERLKQPNLRHNLCELWLLAKQQGVNLSATPPDWLTLLGSLHSQPYYLRYSTGVNGIVSPPPSIMASGVLNLLQTVEEFIHS